MRTTRSLLAAVATLAALGATTAPRPARAADGAAAEALFAQAKTLAEVGKYAEACPKFEASYKLDKALGTLLNLADCEEKIGKIASAWSHWGEGYEFAQATSDKRAAFASGRRDKLTPRLPKIQLDVTAGQSKLEVYRDGVRIDPAAFGVPLPSDPGEHAIEVRRGSEVLEKRGATAVEAQVATVALDLPAIEKAHPPPPPPMLAASNLKTAGIVVAGFGGAGLLTAAGLEIAAIVTKSGVGSSQCFQSVCTPSGSDSINKARTLAIAGQWTGIASLVVGAVGATLIIASPGARPSPVSGSSAGAPRRASIAVSPWVGPGTGGLTVGGAL